VNVILNWIREGYAKESLKQQKMTGLKAAKM